MRRFFFSTVAGKSAAKSPLVPFQSPYLKNVVNKAQFGPTKTNPNKASLMSNNDMDEYESGEDKPSEVPAADHFWTAKVNANVERLQNEKKSDTCNEVSEETITKKHTMTPEPTIVNAAKKTMGTNSYSDGLHEAIAGDISILSL